MKMPIRYTNLTLKSLWTVYPANYGAIITIRYAIDKISY